MKILHRCAALALVLGAVAADAVPESPAGPDAASHDFDFNVGIWHSRIKRVLDPLSGGTHTAVLEGTVRSAKYGAAAPSWKRSRRRGRRATGKV